MTTRSWTPAGIAVSCERTTHPRRGWCAPVCLLLLGALLLTAPAQAQTLGNFCPIGTCDITNPHYVNVYWDSSLAQWDIDVAANSTQMTHGHIDHLTEALIHSEYFVNNTQFGDGALNQYSVTSATLGPSLATGGCGAAPATLDKAHDAIQNLVICFLQANPNLKAPNLILNLFVPPQSMAAPGYCMGKGSEAGDHGQYYGPNFLVDPPVEVSFLPTTGACHGDLAGLFVTVTHEMVEATTDPNYKSPTGWKDGTPGDFYGQEAGDLCESTKFAAVMFLYGSASTYWSDLSAKCSSGYPLSVPQVSKATACGAGQNMSITLTGFFGPMPWDLASNKFGKQTLYLNLLVDHGGKVWEAGNFEGLPPNKDFNPQGKPDVVNFGAGGVSWSQNSITISGFDNNYGKTITTNGAIAEVAPGDQIIVNLAMQESGQFLQTKVFTAPAASQILNLAVTPKGGDPYIFVNRQADVSGTVADAGNCAVQKQWVTLMGWQGMVNPGMVSTSSSGQFQSLYSAPGVAGTQKVNANLANNSSVTASVPVPVHPILNSITPNVGPVAGGQNASLAGDGFDSGKTTVGFSGAAAQVGNVTLNSIAVVTPKSPLGGDGDGTADVVATVNGLDSLSVPYQYVVPGKPYIAFKSTDCKTHYIVVTVYDDQAKPIVVPIQLTAGYPAYKSSGWTASMNTSSGVWVQVDKGGPFTASNTNKNLSNTASFPVLPEGVCDNIKLVTKVDWHIFEKPGELRPEEITELNPGTKVGTGGKKVVVWTRAANVKDATTYVLDPAGTPGGGGLRVSTVGAQQFRGILHGNIFLGGGGMKTESAPGQPTANVREVQFVGPAFSIVRTGQREDAVAPLGRTLRVSFDLPQGNSNPHSFHIVHLTLLDGQPTWVEDGGTQLLAYKSAITRTIEQSGIYALLEVVGTATETPQQQPPRQEKPQQQQPQQQRQEPPAQPQPAPQGSTVLLPDGAFPGGVLTGVVIGPDDKPVPNTPVNIAGGVPITLTGVVIGEEPTPSQPCQPDPTTGQLPPGCQPPPPPPCQPDAAGNLPPGCQPPPPCQPDPSTGLMPAGCAPPTVNQPSDCASVLRRFKALPAGQAAPGAAAPGQTGASPTAVEAVGGPALHTDANGRFAMCVPVDAPKVTVSLTGAKGVVIQGGEVPQKPGTTGVVIQGGTVAEVPVLTGTPALPTAPPSFFQPSQRVSIIGVLRKPSMEQGGRTWLLPAVNAISPDGQQTISTIQTPRDLQPGPANLSFTGGDGQTHQAPGGVFRILRATLDRSKLRSQEGADFEYTVQFGDGSVRACVNVTVAGPVVLMQGPPPQIPLDASGIGHFGGKIRATQVAPGAAIPFDIKPNITDCGGSAPPNPQGAQMQGGAGPGSPGPGPGGGSARPIASMTLEERVRLPDATLVTLDSGRTVSLGALRAEHKARQQRFTMASMWGQQVVAKIPRASINPVLVSMVPFVVPPSFMGIAKDYVDFCKAATPTVCIYLPASTTFKAFLGDPTTETSWATDLDPFITDKSVCEYDGGSLYGTSGCLFYYPVIHVENFKPTGALSTTAACDPPSEYFLDPKGAIKADYPYPSEVFTTGGAPITCVVQVWITK